MLTLRKKGEKNIKLWCFAFKAETWAIVSDGETVMTVGFRPGTARDEFFTQLLTDTQPA